MADYVSKYTGNEVDGILDEAIELPQASSEDVGKFLKYTGDTNPVAWGDPIDISSASDGDVLKYSSSSGVIWSSIYSNIPEYDDGDARKVLTVHGTDNDLIWSYPIDISNADVGDVLKYSYSSGYYWDEPIDTQFASDGEFLKYSSDDGVIWDNPIDTTNAIDGQFLRYSSDHGIMWDNPIDTTYADDGEYLKYSSNTGIMWDNVPGIDTSNAQNGQFLKYSSDTGMMWETLSVFPSGAINGSILTYNNETSSLTWAAGSGTEGQVLTYVPVAGGSGYTVEWADVDRFPVYDTSDPSNDAGKVLTVLGNGTLGWVLPNQ